MLDEYEGIVSDQRESSSKELKANLREALRKSGVLQNVKAQIRKEFIVNLNGKHKFKVESAPPTHQQRIIASTIYHHFQRISLLHSLSVYSAECGLDSHTVLSEVEIIQALNIGYHSNVYKRFVIYNESNSNKTTLLSMLIEEIASKALRGNHDSSTQTDSSGPTARENLETNIRELQASFLNRRDIERLQPMRSIEEKMLSFQRECEERHRKELTSQIAYIRETEISKIKFEENKNTQQRVEILKRQLETEYQIKLQHQIQKESELLQNLNDKEKQMQQTNYELRQKYQLEIESLQNREIALTKKTELESQGLKFLENRLKEMSLNLETKEKELNRMETALNERMKLKVEDIKNEKLSHLQHEFDLLIREKNALKNEKQKFEEINSDNLSKLESFDELRRRLRDTLLILEEKEDEVAMLKFKLSRSSWNDDRFEDQTLPGDRDRDSHHPITKRPNNQTANIQQLLQKNNDLELQLQKLSEELLQIRRTDRDSGISGSGAADQENKKINKSDVSKKLSQISQRYEQEKSQWTKEKELLLKELKLEKSKGSVLEAELASLSQLCREQRAAIHSLPRVTTGSSKRKQISDSDSVPPAPPAPTAPPLTAADVTAMLQAALTLSGRAAAPVIDGMPPPYHGSLPYPAPYFSPPQMSLQNLPYSHQPPHPTYAPSAFANLPSSDNPVSDARGNAAQSRLDEVRKNVYEKTTSNNIERKNINEQSQTKYTDDKQVNIQKMEELKREQERELYELRRAEMERVQQLKVQREEEEREWRRSRDEARRREDRLEAEERERSQLEQLRRMKERENQLYSRTNAYETNFYSVGNVEAPSGGETTGNVPSTMPALKSPNYDHSADKPSNQNSLTEVSNFESLKSVDTKSNIKDTLQTAEAVSTRSQSEYNRNEDNEQQKQQEYEIEQQRIKELEAAEVARRQQQEVLRLETERVQREREAAEALAEKERLLKVASDAAAAEAEERKRKQKLEEERESQRKLAEIERERKDSEREKADKEKDEVEKKKKEKEDAIKRKKDEDAAAIQAARAKVLARRKQKSGGAKEVEAEPEPVPVPEPVKAAPAPAFQSASSAGGARDSKGSHHRGLNQSEDDDLENVSYDGNDDSGEGIVWK